MIHQRLRAFAASGTVRKAAKLAAGTAIGQGIVMLSSPVLTRLFSPLDLGDFGTFTAITSLFAAVICLKLEQSILIADEADVPASVQAAGLTVIGMLAVFSVVAGGAIAFLPRLGVLFTPQVLLIGPVFLLASGFYMINQYLANRAHRFTALSRFQVSKSVMGVGVQIGSAFTPLRAYGLAAGQTLGVALAVIPLAWGNRAMLIAGARLRDRAKLTNTLRRYKSFAIYGAPQSLLNAATASMPILLIGLFFGKAEAGLFWLAFRVLGLPNQVLVESLRASIMNDLAGQVREHRTIRHTLIRSTLGMGVILVPLALGLGMFGDWIFAIAFGPRWADGAFYATILSVAWIFQNAAVPSYCALQLLQRQRQILVLEIAGTILRAGALCIALIRHDIVTVLWLYTLANILQSLMAIVLGAKAARDQNHPQATFA